MLLLLKFTIKKKTNFALVINAKRNIIKYIIFVIFFLLFLLRNILQLKFDDRMTYIVLAGFNRVGVLKIIVLCKKKNVHEMNCWHQKIVIDAIK